MKIRSAMVYFVIGLLLSALIAFRICGQDFSTYTSSSHISPEKNIALFSMVRPSIKGIKVGVLYTPYNQYALGNKGTHPPFYTLGTISEWKKKPLVEWPGAGHIMLGEWPWVKTFDLEGEALTNPEVPELVGANVHKIHAQWLYDMGADFIIWDSTNHAWLDANLSDQSQGMVIDSLKSLLEAWLQLRAQGIATPQVAIWLPIPEVKIGTYLIDSYLPIIENPKYSDLMFKYKGKPLLILVSSDHSALQDSYHKPNQEIVNRLKKQFTIREMWATEEYGSNSNNWSYLERCISDGKEVTPFKPGGLSACSQRISPDPSHLDRIEQIPVTLAYARDHISNRQSATPKSRGYTVLRQLETVFLKRQDVDIVTISSFNTWAATRTSPLCIEDHPTGLYKCTKIGGIDYYKSFVPLLNSPVNKDATPAFTDDFDEEYGVVFEPGGVAGDYYIRLINRALNAIAQGTNPMALYDPEALSVRGVLNPGIQNSILSGWACTKGTSNSILVSIRANGVEIAQVRADQDLSGELGVLVQVSCGSSRRRHGFTYKLTAQQMESLQGQTVTAVGLSESEYSANKILNNTIKIPGL